MTSMIIDSHVHVGLTKYRPVEDLVTLLDKHEVFGAVLVQYRGNTDNDYLRDCLRRFPGRFASLAMVDVGETTAVDAILALAREGFGGLRLQGAPRSPGAHPYAIWSAMEDHGLVASIAGNFDDVTSDSLEELVVRHPALRFRIEHMGGPDVTEPAPYSRFRRLLRFAAYPNVVTMLSAFYWYSQTAYPYNDTVPFAAMAFREFGAARCLWGSDWPPIEDHEGYAQALESIRDLPFITSDADRAMVLGGGAARLWEFGRT